MKTSSNNKSKRLLIAVGVAALILISSSYYFLAIKNGNSPDKSADTESNEKVDLNPPTEAELNETDQFKQNLANNPPGSPATNQSSSSQSVTPVIGYLRQLENGNVESNGYMSGLAEEGGTCTLTLEKDGVKVTESRQAMMDAQGMICGHMLISRNRLSEGTWKGYISYASSTRKGSSEERKIEVK